MTALADKHHHGDEDGSLMYAMFSRLDLPDDYVLPDPDAMDEMERSFRTQVKKMCLTILRRAAGDGMDVKYELCRFCTDLMTGCSDAFEEDQRLSGDEVSSE